MEKVNPSDITETRLSTPLSAGSAWHSFTRALRDHFIQAAEARTPGPTSMHEVVPETDTESPATSSGDGLQPSSQLNPATGEVKTQVIKLRQRFSAIRRSTIHYLEISPQISIATVVTLFVSIIGIHTKAYFDDHGYERNFMELFCFLDVFWNYYSYHVLHKLILKLTEIERLFEPVKKEMESYDKDMEVFAAATPISLEFMSCVLDVPPPPGAKQLAVIFNWTPNVKLINLRYFEKHFLNQYNLILLLKDIRRGSISVSWYAIPTDGTYVMDVKTLPPNSPANTSRTEKQAEEDIKPADYNKLQNLEAVCLFCVFEIMEFVDFRIIQQQFRKHSITRDIFLDVMPKIEGGKIYFKPNFDATHRMLQKLAKLENGFQMLYLCLRETECECHDHKLVADKIKRRAQTILPALKDIIQVVSSAKDQSTSGNQLSSQMRFLECDLYSKVSFMYNGKQMDVHWDEAGLSLFFPAAKCEKDIHFTLKLVNDDYILPQECRDMPLVSVMYQITASDTLPAPVRIRTQHCADVKQVESLTYLRAHCTPPYRFKVLKGGHFMKNVSHGEIELKTFSIVTVLQNIWDWKMELLLHIAYCKDGSADFLVTKDIQAHRADVKEKYSNDTSLVQHTITGSFSTTAISLSIPETPNQDSGWKVEPFFVPATIGLNKIHKYQPGKNIPAIKLLINWQGEGDPRKEFVRIGVQGADFEYFNLTCEPPPIPPIPPPPIPPIPTPHPQRPPYRSERPTLPLITMFPLQSGGVNIIHRIGNHGHDLGIRLLEDDMGAIVGVIENQYRPDQTRKTEAILQRWLEGTGRTPQTWTTLITVLREIELTALAQLIEDGLLPAKTQSQPSLSHQGQSTQHHTLDQNDPTRQD